MGAGGYQLAGMAAVACSELHVLIASVVKDAHGSMIFLEQMRDALEMHHTTQAF